VPVTSEQFQPTLLTPAQPQPAETPAGRKARAAPTDPDRVGVVLIHGIGTQAAAETFLDWTRPLVELLADWRREHGFDVDPVRRSQFSFNGASLPFLELDIPAYAERAAQTWVFTEAWWASQLRAPSVGTVTSYLRHGLPRILQGIRAGYDVREDAWTERVRAELATRQAPTAGPAGASGATAGALEGSANEQREQAVLIEQALEGSRGWAWIRVLDWIQKWLTILAIGPALVLGTVVLAIYAPLRAVPIKPLRDLALLRQTDNFLVQWVGDLPTLLSDPVQSANVRARTVEAIDGLIADGCGRIVLVAHSGGAIVSYTTLLDPVYATRAVDKLVTLGQGLGLAWHLEERTRLLDKGNRLAGDLGEARPALLWYDFWASYDPAPGGPLKHPRDVPLPVTSRPITNRMSILEDHGSYWDNDEGFLIPLIRHLDTAGSRPEESPGSRFFPDSGHRAALIQRRRERVGVLALWRWLAVLAGATPIVVGTLVSPAGGGPSGVGRALTEFWATVPGHEILSIPIDWVAGLVHGPDWLHALGVWGLGVGLLALFFLVVGLVGFRWWAGWDAGERRIAHTSVLQAIDRRRPIAIWIALVVGTALLSVLVTAALLR
jgi:hypothetical protein